MIKRSLYKHILSNVQEYPVILLTGPRQSGKTTLAKFAFPKYQYRNLENLDTRTMALEDPRGFLSSLEPKVILDEIQKAPDLVSYLQQIVDEDTKKKMHFILTGSEQLELTDTVNQSLAGRVDIFKLLPFTINELGSSSLLSNIDELIYEGFYPKIHAESLDANRYLSNYIETYIQRDVRKLLKIVDLNTFYNFLKLTASQVGQLIDYSYFSSSLGIDVKTVKSWLSVLEASYVIFRLPPFHKNIKKRLVKSSKLYFFDVGLASHLVGIKKSEHVSSHPLKGFLFENLIIAEILKSKYHNKIPNNLFFYRDSNKNEVDILFDNLTSANLLEIKSSKTFSPSFFKVIAMLKKQFSGEDFFIQKSGVLLGNCDKTKINFKGSSILSMRHLNGLEDW